MGNSINMMTLNNMGKCKPSFKKVFFVAEIPHFIEEISIPNTIKWGILLT